MIARNVSLELAAETHFYFKPLLEKALKNQFLTDDARDHLGQNWATDFERWEGNYSRHFFDMTTMIRLGAAVETSLRDCFMRSKGYATKAELETDPNYRMGAFQRIAAKQNRICDAAGLLSSIGIDLESMPFLLEARKVMLHRHLYSHSVGVIDQKYVDDWLELTGEDLAANPLLNGYRQVDTFWFGPLSKLTDNINDLRNFVRALG